MVDDKLELAGLLLFIEHLSAPAQTLLAPAPACDTCTLAEFCMRQFSQGGLGVHFAYQ